MSAATPNPLCRVVVSYAREDEAHRETFRKHVADVERSGVEFFDDRDIPPGVPWKPVLFGSLERADIVVPLITANYVASDFCMEKELGRAMRRWEAGECRLFPVNVAPFDLTRNSPLRRLQWIPSDKPITGYGNAAAREWRRVTQVLRRLIEDMGGLGATDGVDGMDGMDGIGGMDGADGVDGRGSASRRRSAAPSGAASGGAGAGEVSPVRMSNHVIGSSVGTWTQIDEMHGDLTINLPQPPSDDGRGGKRRSR